MKINYPNTKYLFINACLIFLCISCAPIPDSRDADEANEIYSFIQAHFDIKPEMRDGISGYSGPGVSSTNLIIYGMISESDQNKLINLLKAEKPNRKWKKIKIDFSEKEIWIEKGSGQARGEEKLIRSVTLK